MLTVNHYPVTDIVPHVEQHDPWAPSSILRDIVRRQATADEGLLNDLADVRGALIEGL